MSSDEVLKFPKDREIRGGAFFGDRIFLREGSEAGSDFRLTACVFLLVAATEGFPPPSFRSSF